MTLFLFLLPLISVLSMIVIYILRGSSLFDFAIINISVIAVSLFYLSSGFYLV